MAVQAVETAAHWEVQLAAVEVVYWEAQSAAVAMVVTVSVEAAVGPVSWVVLMEAAPVAGKAVRAAAVAAVAAARGVVQRYTCPN